MPLIRTWLCLVLFLFSSVLLRAERRVFDIDVANIKVGNMVVEKVTKDSLTIYIFRSEVDAWLLVRVHVSHLITCVYKNDKLIKADIRSVINKETYISSVLWNKDHYDYDCSTYKYHKAGTLAENLDFSVVKMYFEEPTGKQKIFAENYGLICPIRTIHPSTYCLDVDKNRNTFHYANGCVQQVEMETPLFNYVIRRTE
jgi:hypothetical protein